MTFDETRLEALMGRRRDARTPCLWTRLESPRSRATPLAALFQVEYAKTLAKIMKARGLTQALNFMAKHCTVAAEATTKTAAAPMWTGIRRGQVRRLRYRADDYDDVIGGGVTLLSVSISGHPKGYISASFGGGGGG